jgi:CBS domain-containing protein
MPAVPTLAGPAVGPYVRWFRDLGIDDVPRVGGKNASLGELYRELRDAGVRVPDGFAVTVDAYRVVVEVPDVHGRVAELLRGIDGRDVGALAVAGAAIRTLIEAAPTIHSDALARGAADMMRTRRIRHLPVVDRGGRLVGIVTDRDLRQVVFDPALRARAGGLAEALQTMTVRDVMTWAVLTVRADTPLREAARIMREQKIGALPVVQAGKVVGVISEIDVLNAFARALGDGFAKPYRWAFAR